MKTNRLIKWAEHYKVLHFLFWTWATVQLYHELIHSGDSHFPALIPVLVNTILFQVIAVYVILYYARPKYLNTRKYFRFLAFAFLTILISAVLHTLSRKFIFFRFGISTSNDLIIVITQFIDTIWKAVVITATIEIMARYKTEQKNKQLEKEKLEHELAFLKAQINPHFLFNTINSVYVLIQIDPDKAADTLLKFSSMLRYQLYECTGSSIELERELNLIGDFIELEKMRKGAHVEIYCSLPEAAPGFRIAPLLLIPVVENAFKHVSDQKQGADFIRIKAILEKDRFRLEVQNSCNPEIAPMWPSGGIGLKNMRRRLELLYPDRHELEVLQTKGIFKVNLSLYE